jgi:hypothetical protein
MSAQLLVLLVKADTIDVNVAGSKRFTTEDWGAAAEVFKRELEGVQLVDEQQVRTESAPTQLCQAADQACGLLCTCCGQMCTSVTHTE